MEDKQCPRRSKCSRLWFVWLYPVWPRPTHDGNWCHKDGRRLSIQGQAIVTPGGIAMEGNYSRHWFSYVVPAPEPGAGDTILMTLLNENTVHVRRGETAPEHAEVWQRCLPSVSGLDVRRLL
jgi:hypothetical protein